MYLLEALFISSAHTEVNVYSGISPYGLSDRSFAILAELFSPAVASIESGAFFSTFFQSDV